MQSVSVLKPAIFLDRDGVINKMVYHPNFGLVDSPANPDEFFLLAGVSQAVRQINEMSLPVIVISNQPGVAKRKFTEKLLEATTAKMHRVLAQDGARLDAVYYCLHHPEAQLPQYKSSCACRKPRPGLLLQAAQEWGISLEDSYFIGDGITDILAGQAAGTRTILIASRKPYLYEALAERNANPDYIVNDLNEAVKIIQTHITSVE